jgi:hypothetical protein
VPCDLKDVGALNGKALSYPAACSVRFSTQNSYPYSIRGFHGIVGTKSGLPRSVIKNLCD